MASRRRYRIPAEMLSYEMSTRYWALISPERAQELHVALIGAGAIGSNAAVALAKMGVRNFTVWDMDTVEAANVGVQAYTPRHIGMPKTEALAEILADISNGAINVTQHSRFTPKTRIPGRVDVVVASLDNIPTREMVYAATRRMPAHKPILFLDPRMGAETYEVRATVFNKEGAGFTDADTIAYVNSFHKNVPPAPCGANSTPYCAMACGAAVAAKVKQFIKDEPIHTWSALHVPNTNAMKGGMNAGHCATGEGGAHGQRPASVRRERAGGARRRTTHPARRRAR